MHFYFLYHARPDVFEGVLFSACQKAGDAEIFEYCKVAMQSLHQFMPQKVPSPSMESSKQRILAILENKKRQKEFNTKLQLILNQIRGLLYIK